MTDRLITAALRFTQKGLIALEDRIARLENEGWEPMTASQAADFVRCSRDLLFECDAFEDTLANAMRRGSDDQLVPARLNEATARLGDARQRLGMLIAIMRIGRSGGHSLVDLAA